MIKISDAIYEIITGNPALNFAFHHRLLNLSQVARYIKASVETRARKEVTESAVLMNLSRLQAKIGDVSPEAREGFILDKVTVHSGLCSLTVSNTTRVQPRLNKLFTKVRENSGYITITEGIGEVTLLMGDEYFDLAGIMLEEKLRYIHRNIASVGVKFSDRILEIPGVMYQVLQQITLQNINVIEVASTATEFNIYLAEKDVEQAFESIFRRFSRKNQRRREG